MIDESSNLEEQKQKDKRKKILIWTLFAFVLLGLITFFLWFFVFRFEKYTDDAYVHGNLVELTPQVEGIVSSINTDNTDYVEKGQILIQLDPTDYTLAFEKSKNQLAEVVRNVVYLFLKVEELEAQLAFREAQLVKAEQDYENRVELVKIGGVSKEEFEHVEAALKSALSLRQESYYMLQAAYAQVQRTTVQSHPLTQKAIDQVKYDWISLQRCKIISPVSGYVAQRSAQLGEFVKLGEPLLAIVPVNEIWVDANFKETQLADFRIGQSVKVRSDLYGRKVMYKGKIVGLNPGTGNVFSVLPPQNATGNWIKIVQRVPVRISLDINQLKKYPLWLGLSMNITVDIRDVSGEMLASARQVKPIYQTDLYSEQEEGVDLIISEIIKSNLGPYEE